MDASGAGTRNPLTPRFDDPGLEADFQAEMAVTNGPQGRVGALISAGLWIAAAILVPAAIEIDRGLVTAVCIAMAAVNLGAFVASKWATTLDRQQAIGLGLNGLAGLAVLVLIEASGTSDRYAAPALLLIAMFAFVVIRLRFVFALVAASTYLIGYVLVVLTRPNGGNALDIFIVASAIVVGLGATTCSNGADATCSPRNVSSKRRRPSSPWPTRPQSACS